MKRLLFFCVASLAFVACHNANTQVKDAMSTDSNTVAKADAPVIKFAEEIHQFAKINEGDKVSYNFKFTNTGKSPLIISSATATCGCTIPEPPKEPILPGKDGFIKVVFNSEGKPGINDKVITVTSNANPNVSSVHLVGEVVPKK
ncbi:hypothetical protein ABIB40_003975 [Pedobacter sp. UYP30]|uniref:DUF1573 domain-containing protein n=1 Tax=Pedobacter sp. UYP30 TaxID=1756400 RepID=UPI00339AA263